MTAALAFERHSDACCVLCDKKVQYTCKQDLNMRKRLRANKTRRTELKRSKTFKRENKNKTSLTSAAEIEHALLLRHQSCDPKSFAHASLKKKKKFKLRGGYAVKSWRKGNRGKQQKDCYFLTETGENDLYVARNYSQRECRVGGRVFL